MTTVARTLRMKPIKILATVLAVVALALTVTVDTAAAQGRHGGHGGHVGWHRGGGYGHGHGHWGPGLFWGGIGLGIGIGAINSFSYYGRPLYPYPGYVVVEPPVAYYDAPPQPVPAPAPAYPSPALPDPVIYPRNGQDATQTEADRRECNRWAMAQPRAMAEASVFYRATLACMEGRGYTVK